MIMLMGTYFETSASATKDTLLFLFGDPQKRKAPGFRKLLATVYTAQARRLYCHKIPVGNDKDGRITQRPLLQRTRKCGRFSPKRNTRTAPSPPQVQKSLWKRRGKSL